MGQAENDTEAAGAPSELNVGLGKMNFKDALERLGIAEYGERIFNSNSHGELFHLYDYIQLAQLPDVSWFKDWFNAVVKQAELNWGRPESVFQHIPKLLEQEITHNGTELTGAL